jgi:hypothetical protein
MTARGRAGAAALAALAAAAGAVALHRLGSRALTSAPSIDFGRPGRAFGSAAAVRRAAAARADALPLPAGGNFNGVRWEEAGAGLTEADVDAVQQYNAACQWLRALADGRQAAQARAILAAVPRWPAFRGNDLGAMWTRASAAPGGELGRAVLADCRASHDREVSYAASRGLTPSS